VPRILVVDDQPDSLLAAQAALAAAGHEPVLAADWERALELLAAGGIDLVVLDPAMPLHDGGPVLAAAGPLPVLALSATAVAADPRVRAHLDKPFTAEALVAAVEEVLSN
jgi:CheY-like chemotaxis protein